MNDTTIIFVLFLASFCLGIGLTYSGYSGLKNKKPYTYMYRGTGKIIHFHPTTMWIFTIIGGVAMIAASLAFLVTLLNL